MHPMHHILPNHRTLTLSDRNTRSSRMFEHLFTLCVFAASLFVAASCSNRIQNQNNTTMKQRIDTPNAPAAIGPYSQAIDSGHGLVFVSGQLPIDPATGAFPEGGVKEQTRQSLTNARSILEAAGLSLANVVKTTVFLADMGDFAAMNEVYAEFFAEPFPARSAVAVKTLPKNALVEVECIAAR